VFVRHEIATAQACLAMTWCVRHEIATAQACLAMTWCVRHEIATRGRAGSDDPEGVA
jgi:hypothetical protein